MISSDRLTITVCAAHNCVMFIAGDRGGKVKFKNIISISQEERNLGVNDDNSNLLNHLLNF